VPNRWRKLQSHLDLRAQKFRTDLPRQQRLAIGQHLGRRILDDIARRPIDQEIFLLDAKSKFRLGRRHPKPRVAAFYRCCRRLADRPPARHIRHGSRCRREWSKSRITGLLEKYRATHHRLTVKN
jgi:hypothetical protein